MASDLKIATIAAPAGLDLDSPPEKLDAQSAPVLQNFLVHYPSKAVMRGPMRTLLSSTDQINQSDGLKVVGAWICNDNVLLGFRAVGSGFYDPIEAARRTDITSSASLSDASTSRVLFSTTAGTDSHDTAGSVNVTPGHAYVRLGQSVYGFAFDGTAHQQPITLSYQSLTAMCVWNGISKTLTAHANAPHGGQDIAAFARRLFVLGGQDPAGTGDILPNVLWYSDTIDDTTTLTDALTSWQDDVSGLTNKIVVGSANDDIGTGLGHCGQNLAVFKRRSTHILSGSGPSTFAIKNVSNTIGCVDPRSVVDWEDGCFFLSDEGFKFFDGVSFEDFSSGVRSRLLLAIQTELTGLPAHGARVSATRMPNNYIALSIGRSPSLTTADVDSTAFCAVLHVPSKRWVDFTSAQLPNTYATHFIRTNNGAVVLGASNNTLLFDASLITLSEHEFGLSGIDTAFGGSHAPIPAKWQSRLINLSEPAARSQLLKYALDYNFTVDSAADDANNGWYVTLVTGDSTALQAQYQVPASGSPTTSHTYRRRHTKDTFGEANDLQVQVEWKSTALTLTKAEIYSSYIVYQMTRARPRE